MLVESHVPVTGKELAQKTGADHLLLLRLLRFLVAMRAIGEAGVDTYVANNVTKHLAIPKLEVGVNHTFDVIEVATAALPSFLAKTDYRNPTDPKNCAFQQGFSTQDDLFEWFPKHPEYLNDFNLWMTGQREGRANWLDSFPFEERIVKGFWDCDDEVMLVDVGGARGHEIEAIKKRYPTLPGRVVLQDLPDTIAQALTVSGMEVLAHDFFAEQPIKGQWCTRPAFRLLTNVSARCTCVLSTQRPPRLVGQKMSAHPLAACIRDDARLLQDNHQ